MINEFTKRPELNKENTLDFWELYKWERKKSFYTRKIPELIYYKTSIYDNKSTSGWLKTSDLCYSPRLKKVWTVPARNLSGQATEHFYEINNWEKAEQIRRMINIRSLYEN